MPIITLGVITLIANIYPYQVRKLKFNPAPVDYLWAQRAYPFQNIPSKDYYEALNSQRERNSPLFDWSLAGPNNIGGRITDLAMHDSDTTTIYAATASGGVWKSIDAGTNWFPITDMLPSLSIGDIAIDPSDKNVIYCGTGESNGGGSSVTYDGLGLFKSMDGGQNWQSIGLAETGSIGRIEVDPQNPDRIFVAAMGHLFGNNPERGVYRSLNGGQSWTKTLFINDSVGFIDLAIHPQNPDTVFAVSWERIRRPNTRVYGGPGCGIWRSYDGGDHWEKLTNGLPGGSTNGRIGIAISRSNPSVLYATIARKNGTFEGVYRSNNNGDSWSVIPQNDNPGYSSYGWWFGQIRVHPLDSDHIYNLGIDWIESSDAGNSWLPASNALHADYHAFYIHPAKPSFQVVGNDGGIYISKNGGVTWQGRPIPSLQFYTSEINFQHPELFSGGAQDNGTWASKNGGLTDWVRIFGGDGFVTLVNPLIDTLIYAESQYGGFAGTNGASAPLANRYNWNCPYIFDPNDPSIMYFGAEKLFKSTDAGLNWTPISHDLSNGSQGSGGLVYGTITSIAASPVNPDVLIVGTDDGNVWVTNDGGMTWNKVSDNLPRRWVTKVVADYYNEQTMYVCFSGFRHDENMAHVYKSYDMGQNWMSISGDLPDIPVNDLILDPLDPNYLYLATDAGVFSTVDGGQQWMSSNLGMPRVPVLDLTFHPNTRTMVAATYGRAMFRTVAPIPGASKNPVPIGSVRISPNPFQDELQLSISLYQESDIQIELFNLSGISVLKKSVEKGLSGTQELGLNAAGLSQGVYLLKISSQGKKSICQKIIKQYEE